MQDEDLILRVYAHPAVNLCVCVCIWLAISVTRNNSQVHTYIVRHPAPVDQAGKCGIQLKKTNQNKYSINCLRCTAQLATHIDIVATDQPQAKHELEQAAQPEGEQPRQHPAARADANAVVHQVGGDDEQRKVRDEQAAENPHRHPDVRLEERRVQLRRFTAAQHVDHL